MLTICTYWWGDKYEPFYVERLAAGIKRSLNQEYKFICMNGSSLTTWTDIISRPIDDRALLSIPGCFARLRLFDPGWQNRNNIQPGEKIVCMDLDAVVTGNLDETFNRNEPFSILTGANASNPCPYNGSVWMLQAGYRPDIWFDFSLEEAKKVPYDSFPDDQAWFAAKLPGVNGWRAGKDSGIYAFKKPGWPKGESLPDGAKLVVFPGWRDPSKFEHIDWIRANWK